MPPSMEAITVSGLPVVYRFQAVSTDMPAAPSGSVALTAHCGMNE